MLDRSTSRAAESMFSLGPGEPLTTGAMTSVCERDGTDKRVQWLSAAIELQIHLDDCRNLSDAARVVVQRCRESLDCKRVLLAWRFDPRSNCRVVADSRPHDSQRDEVSRFASAAIEEMATRNDATAWPPAENDARHAMLAVARFAEQEAANDIVAIPLVDSSGRSRGAIVATDSPNRADTLGLFETISTPLVSKLNHLYRSEPGRVQEMIQHLAASVSGSRRNLVLWSIGAFMLLMLIPVRYQVRADCELQPVQRRFVAAPLDGPLSGVMVRPGDSVGKGDLLATINPREIEYELASARAEWNRANQEKKGLIAKQDFAASKIASLETERLKSRASLLEYRLANLEIRSPIDGVVVAGDLKEAEGTPVTKGESLFEVAPLGKMVVEIAVPEHEWVSVRPGMPVSFELHAFPGQSRRGVLASVHPRAELRDQDNVFIGEVIIDDPDGILRPGMRGRSWIVGDRHPWGWNLFHRAFDVARSTVRWTLGW